MSLTLSIVIPAYNEALRIESSVEKVLSWMKNNPRQTEIIFVVEKSEDDTLQILQRITSNHSFIKIIPATEHRGKGAAVKRGMLEAQNELCLMSDVDWSVPTDLIEVFCQSMEASDEPDICFGSRKHPDSKIVNPQPCYRRAIGILLNYKLRREGLTESHDTQCGFKMFRKEAAHRLFSELQEEGFPFDIEILLRAKYAGYKIIELPVTWYNDTRTTVNIREGFPKMLAAIKRFKQLKIALENKCK